MYAPYTYTGVLSNPVSYQNTLNPSTAYPNYNTIGTMIGNSVYTNPNQAGFLTFAYPPGHKPYGPNYMGQEWASDIYNCITKYLYPYKTPYSAPPQQPPISPPPTFPPIPTPTPTPTPGPSDPPTNIDPGNKGGWGDPHFHFTDKTGKAVTIDHKGIDGNTYNILNADGLDIDAEYKQYHDPQKPQLMGAVRVDAGNQELLMNDGKVFLDGEQLENGTNHRLNDGRTIEISSNGSAKIHTKDKKGVIDINYNNKHYNIDPSGQISINKNSSLGGILGFLTLLGKTLAKNEILDKFDTNNNKLLDDNDNKLASIFTATTDIGLYSY